MALATGTRLGTYEITGTLGAGGMGEVYRARDTRLGRSVAIKVLPSAFAADPDRVPRFEREAQVLASLNHPHIAALYGMEQTGEAVSAHFLIMELVEGETLLERLQRGPLPVIEALAIAVQIADALECAHERGVVHRDLKPANVKITPDDKVKVLDFGLAKAMDSSPAASSPANSPTLSVLATQAGLVMGTAAYMSPEQAKGLATDRRSDVFSFGVVLYELLTARQPFRGDTAAEIMASVIIREADLTVLPAGLNPRIREVIARCLEKSPKKRWQAMGDLKLELEALIAAPHHIGASSSGQTQAVRSPLWTRAIPVAAAVLVTAMVSTLATRWLTPPPSREVYRFSMASPRINQNFQSLAWSPDGSKLVYLTIGQLGVRQLMLRTMSDLEARPIAGAAGQISSPVFSPDGRSVVFASLGAELALKKIAITGGAAVTLCTLTPPYSGPDWKGNDILFAQPSGVMRVSADGGEPELIVKVGPNERIASPQYIDDRGTMLFSLTTEPLLSAGWEKGQVIVQNPDGTRQVIATGASDARYLSSGHIVFVAGSTLMAVPFDAATRRMRGSPVPVVEGVARGASQRFAGHYAVSASGALAYVPALSAQAVAQRTLALVDMNGKAQSLMAPANAYLHPRVSPDGTRIVVATDTGTESAIWILEVSGNSLPSRLTFEGNNQAPIWSPDGQWITFQSDRDGRGGLFRQRADGSGSAERLTTSEPMQAHFPYSWSPDGKTLTFRVAADAANHIWTWSNDDRTTKLLMPGAPAAVTSEFSADGRWLAYASNELNPMAHQVFVQPFPLTGAKYQVNPMTASTPVWSRDGKRLFFAFANRIFSATIQTTPTFTAGQSVEIKLPNIMPSSAQLRHYDLMPDGKHFLVVLQTAADGAQQAPTQINIVLNWLDELKAKTAAP
jgi:serine/threonine protein kinase